MRDREREDKIMEDFASGVFLILVIFVVCVFIAQFFWNPTHMTVGETHHVQQEVHPAK